MSSLWQDFLNNTGNKIHKWAHYFPVYERYFSPFVGRPLIFFEFGVGDGGSAQMWRRYFGAYAIIVGIDIRSECLRYADNQIAIRIGDQSDTKFLDELVSEFGAPDIILDDGSHLMHDICSTFNHLYQKMPKHGVYMVEDLHTAYWPEYGGGLLRENTFIEHAKKLIDELNADLSRGAVTSTEFTHNTSSISFYNSIAVIERGIPIQRYDMQIGSSPHYNE